MSRLQQLIETQGDYLVFAAVALAVIAGVAVALRRFRPTARLPWWLWGLFLAVLASGWVFVQQAGENARKENVALVSALAPTYAAELERMGHSRITETTSPDDPLYLELIQAQIRWQKLNPIACDIYTFRKRPDGTNILVVDSETDYDRNGVYAGEREERTPIGTPYPEPDEALEQAFKGKASFGKVIITDYWGSWVGAFEPMRDENGRVEAVLGVDFDARSWQAAIAKGRHPAIWVTAFFLALVLGGGTGITVLRAGIAQRIKVAQMLRDSEERLRLTIRQMPLGFIEWDVEANVRNWNPAAERIFGFTADETMGRKVFPLIVAPAALKQVDEIFAGLLQRTGGTHSVNENLTKDGRTITCEWFNTTLTGPDNRVVSVFSIFQDITERVNLEKQLQRSERLSAIGQLAAGVAHDFNNLLTVIIGHAGLLLVRPTMTGTARADLQRIEEAASRAASLTRQLLAFSRRQAMFPRTLDLGRAVQDVAVMLSRLISADMKFHVVVSGNVPPVEADPAMIEQVITNLVLNARDALENRPGDITVSVDAVAIAPDAVPGFLNARPGKFVRLKVRDTGMGIPPENFTRIFEPFFTTKAQGKGTGLGLSVVLGVVQQHGGWIGVESAPGKGTTFDVYLPPSDKPLVSGAGTLLSRPAAPVAAPGRVHTILLAEDEQFVRELAIQILEQAGYAVIATADGVQALEQWARHRDRIDLLFTDMVMPNGLGGRDLARRILADCPELPVIYASGYSMDTAAPGFCESERMVFLQKPYQPELLLASIRKCLKLDRA